MKKHLFSFLMALALLLTLFPASVSAADGYAVDAVTIGGASVSVRVTAETNCALFVGLYDENGKMLEARTETVTGNAQGQSVSVQFNHEIVNGVYAKAFLLNSDTCAPLCEGVDSLFHAEEYALIERIAIETTANNVTTKTASVLGQAGTDASFIGPNSETLQRAYNQSKEELGSSWGAQAQLRFSNGTRRTVTLDDSKNYRTSVVSDNANAVTIASLTLDAMGYPVDATGNRVYVAGTSGNDGNWIAEPFTAGHIVRISSNDDGYHLQSVNAARVYHAFNFTFDGNRILSNGQPLTFGDTTIYAIYADSTTRFVVEDMAQGSYKSYTGVKNAPTVNFASGVHVGDNPVAYIYHENGLAKLIFVTNAWNVNFNSSNYILFLAANSTSKLIESDDGKYYEISAVEKNEVKTVRVKWTPDSPVSFTANGTTFMPGAGYDKEYNCVILNNVSYDSNDFITKGSFVSADRTIGKYQGIRRVSDKEVCLNTANTSSINKAVAENIRVYFVDGNNIEQIAYGEILDDTKDWVYYVEDDGEIIYLFIVDYEDDGNATTVTTCTLDSVTKVAAGCAVTLPSGVTSVTGGQALSFQVLDPQSFPMTSANVTVSFQYTSTDNGFTKTVDASETSGVWSVVIPSDIKPDTNVFIVVTVKAR